MVKLITQETFDNAVKENIDDLGMDPEDALQDAVVQFEKQGVDLSNIIKKLVISEEKMEKINQAIKSLENKTKSKCDSDEIIAQLEIIKNECDKGIEVRVAAGKIGAYNTILSTLKHNQGNTIIEKFSLKTLLSLMTKQPDLLDDQGIEVMVLYLKNEELEIKKIVLKLIRECCILHEMNRQKIFAANIVENIKELLSDRYQDLLKDLFGVCRSLVLDDDVRVEFGKAHEHARIIASESLCGLIGLLSRFKTEEALVNDIILTVSVLMVRTEFCKKVEDVGGLELIKEIMESFVSNEKIIRQCFKLLKALAGNDECKAHIVQKNLAPSITEALRKNMRVVPTAVAGLSSVAALTLRSPENSKVFYNAGISSIIVDTMKLHCQDKQIQKTASWAVRNMVSRSRYQSDLFIELGIEDILQENLNRFKEIEYDTKAALRDLGCNVHLKEEWTGQGGALTSDVKQTN